MIIRAVLTGLALQFWQVLALLPPGENDGSTRKKPDRLIRLSEVMDRTGLTRASLYKLIQEGAFPEQIKITGRSVAWIESEIEAWINAKILDSRKLDA